MNTHGATVNRGEIVSMYAGLDRNQHNTKTALHRVVDDWLYNISDGNLTVLLK